MRWKVNLGHHVCETRTFIYSATSLVQCLIWKFLFSFNVYLNMFYLFNGTACQDEFSLFLSLAIFHSLKNSICLNFLHLPFSLPNSVQSLLFLQLSFNFFHEFLFIYLILWQPTLEINQDLQCDMGLKLPFEVWWVQHKINS